MLCFYVANKAGQARFEHARGPIEFGRDPHRPRGQVIQVPLVSNNQLDPTPLIVPLVTCIVETGRTRCEALSPEPAKVRNE
jgi:hypothetical protein